MHWSLFGTGECICCKFPELLEAGGYPSVLGTLPQGASKADCSPVLGSSSARLFQGGMVCMCAQAFDVSITFGGVLPCPVPHAQ